MPFLPLVGDFLIEVLQGHPQGVSVLLQGVYRSNCTLEWRQSLGERTLGISAMYSVVPTVSYRPHAHLSVPSTRGGALSAE